MKLGSVLRYALGGGVYLLALAALGAKAGVVTWTSTKSEPTSTERLVSAFGTIGGATALFALALLLGTILYTVHRALPYPAVLRLLAVVLDKESRTWGAFNLFVEVPFERRLHRRQWQRRGTEHFAAEPLSEWGAQVHFLYCAGWAILGAWWTAVRLSWKVGHCGWCLAAVAATPFALALFANVRFLCLERGLPEGENTEEPMRPPGS